MKIKPVYNCYGEADVQIDAEFKNLKGVILEADGDSCFQIKNYKASHTPIISYEIVLRKGESIEADIPKTPTAPVDLTRYRGLTSIWPPSHKVQKSNSEE